MFLKNTGVDGVGIMVNFKSMSRKEKLEYIWDYYKIHILSTLFVLFLIVSFIHGQITKVDYVANLTIVGGITNDSKRVESEKAITALVVKDGDKKKQALIDVIPILNAENPEPQLLQKFTVRMATKEIDVVVLDKSMFDTLMKQEAFLKLDKINGLDLNAIQNDKIKATDNQNNTGIYAISAENVKVLQDMGLNTKNKVVAIMSTSQHKDSAILIFKWLLNIK